MITFFDIENMHIARFNSRYSSDPSKQVGCYIRSMGGLNIHCTNTVTKGVDITFERTKIPDKYLWIEHAERNGIYQAAAIGISLIGATMYLYWYPCVECARAIVQSGIGRLVALEPDFTNTKWNFDTSREILKAGNVHVDFLDGVSS